MKLLKQNEIRRIRDSRNKGELAYKEFGKHDDIDNYTDEEISEMSYGIYKHKKVIITDGDYAVELSKVVGAICQLQEVTYFKKPTIDDYKTNAHNTIKNIRTFYVKKFYLISDEEIYKNVEHDITKVLLKVGAYRRGKNNFRELFAIKNDYLVNQRFKQGSFPQDLYYPIKQFINKLFFEDDYRISDFVVKSSINIK